MKPVLVVMFFIALCFTCFAQIDTVISKKVNQLSLAENSMQKSVNAIQIEMNRQLMNFPLRDIPDKSYLFLPIILFLIFFSVFMRKLIYSSFDLIKFMKGSRPIKTGSLNPEVAAIDPHQPDAIAISQTNPMVAP